jgi:hypothetical protein
VNASRTPSGSSPSASARTWGAFPSPTLENTKDGSALATDLTTTHLGVSVRQVQSVVVVVVVEGEPGSLCCLVLIHLCVVWAMHDAWDWKVPFHTSNIHPRWLFPLQGPAPLNLEVPPYNFLTDSSIRVSELCVAIYILFLTMSRSRPPTFSFLS